MRHHRGLILSTLTAAALADLAAPLPQPWNDIRVKHAWDAVPANWECLGYPAAGTKIDLHVALKSHRENALIDALYEVSDPKHPKHVSSSDIPLYGKHLSKEQVAELVAPHPDTLDLVNSWLQYNRVPPSSVSVTHGGNWLTITGVPVYKANELLGATYELYRNTKTNETIIRTVGYALPGVLHAHVKTVAPTTFFASTQTLQMTPRSHPVRAAATQVKEGLGKSVKVPSSREEEPEENFVTPDYLRWLYKTFAYKPASMGSNRVGIVGFDREYPNPRDLSKFMGEFRSDATAATYTVLKINRGRYEPSHPSDEANMNVQYASAMAFPTPHTFYSIGGNSYVVDEKDEPAKGDLYLEWHKYLAARTNIPQTISSSYGSEERDLPPEYAEAVCKLFAQLGARGVSLLIASGNDGVGAEDCKGNDGKVQFAPLFPASCPYVTSVGGTTSHLPEVAASLSGGGFSNYFPRPNYQKKAVPAFLRKLGRRHKGRYNSSGRGIPDVSAQAIKYLIVSDDLFGPVNGTSCAAPTVAGIIALLNDFLISEGNPPLGFLNPWLYGDGLRGPNDIAWGSNPGCKTNGFPAVGGWDPVTGLGTLDFFELQHVLAYPANKETTRSLNNSDGEAPLADLVAD